MTLKFQHLRVYDTQIILCGFFSLHFLSFLIVLNFSYRFLNMIIILLISSLKLLSIGSTVSIILKPASIMGQVFCLFAYLIIFY